MRLKDKVEVGEFFYDSEYDVWTVRLEDVDEGVDAYFDCKTQYDAEVLSRLVRIERLLSKCTTS